MMSLRLSTIAAVVSLGWATVVPAGSGALAAEKGPPACAKIMFRPLPSGQNDGEQEAGIYTSRFSHIELKAAVKGGEPQDYYLTARNKKLAPVAAPPAAAVNCANDKKMPAPAKAAARCTGQRFATVIAHSGKDKVALLYALHGHDWQYCGAGALATES